MKTRKRLVSGLKPTGELTLGNYLGSVKNIVNLQRDYEAFVFVANLHSLTNDVDPPTLQANTKNVLRVLLAAGFDFSKNALFLQSDVSEHAQLCWVLENQTTIGELSRMTQYKDKSQFQKQSNKTTKIQTGLLTYPALMAADILLYNPDIVPVGQDQKQHLELTKNIAQRFNNRFGSTFQIPRFWSPKTGGKIMSLTNPERKMSKSNHAAPNSFISLLEPPEKARGKIMQAVTDSENKVYASGGKKGVTNLLNIFASIQGVSLDQAQKTLQNANYKELKEKVAYLVVNLLQQLQEKMSNYPDEKLNQILSLGKKKAKAVATKQYHLVKRQVGLA